MGEYDFFTRYLISYPSQELDIVGFLNVPRGEGSFPVIVAIHGYIDPSIYETLDYTTRYADALARSGFLVLHPNLRGYPPSDSGENLFRVGMAKDILNLVGIVRASGGRSGPLEKADPERIGLWGHSMGGGISLRVITVDPRVDAAVLYGAMSGDELQNFVKIGEWSAGTRGVEERAVPPDFLDEISPINFLDRIAATVSIHHGADDELVPLAWSEDLCQRLIEQRKTVSCYTYPDQPHTFFGSGDQLFIERTIDFFKEQLAD
jgi:dipeptidyl aminopeptidase/acylaminoacyl peptidase